MCVCVCGGGGGKGRKRWEKMFTVDQKVLHLLPSGRLSPKLMIVSKSLPRQLGSSHLFTAEQEHTHTITITRGGVADVPVKWLYSPTTP